MRILTFSTLYPNAVFPHHGIFVETRLRKLVETGRVEARVVAPSPWFPGGLPDWAPFHGAYAPYACIPAHETRHGLDIVHPRYLLIPKVGMTLAPFALAATAERAMRAAQRAGFDFDLIDAHYFYPDGVAAAIVARRLQKPLTITARGSDITEIALFPLQRRLIYWAAGQAAGVITVCQALKDEMLRQAEATGGLAPEKVHVLRNGVDLERFRPADPAEAQARLGVEGPVLLSVGHLIPRKGHDLVIRALADLDGFTLLIVGLGPERANLERLAASLGVAQRVRFCGAVDQAELRIYYSAATMLVLASDREGWPNVLLESMACGTPVVATRVWGSPEVVGAPAAGILVPQRDAPSIAGAIRALHQALPDRVSTRAYAEKFSWDATSEGQIALFSRILGR
ncbi:MAG: glycosyltransferase family 4 protein [Alphaproteobacteria bacterium]|nr:glycosyltransferase family 4 protein [Alphaproteobacteria bacterium]